MLGSFVAEIPFTTRIEISFPICKCIFHLLGLPVHLHVAKYQKDIKLGKHLRATEMSLVTKRGQIVGEDKSIECVGTYYLYVNDVEWGLLTAVCGVVDSSNGL